MNRVVMHIDFNSYFASVEQQANPNLRGQPVGVTGGDRLNRTVLGAASVEAKKYGVKTGMMIWEAKKLCPQLILVRGDSDKYLSCTTKFLNILKDYTPALEVFSIDEAFLELPSQTVFEAIAIAKEIKRRISCEIGAWISCSVGISYNKLLAKLAGSLQKPDGLVVIADQKRTIEILDTIELDQICGIGPRIKLRLFNLGITNFKKLREVPKQLLRSSFKSYGEVLYNMARGIDHSAVVPFYQKEAVKSIGQRYTIDHDSDDLEEITGILLKISEMVAKRARDKKMVGKTIHCYFRYALESKFKAQDEGFAGDGMQCTITETCDGLDILRGALRLFLYLWDKSGKIRMIGVSLSNLRASLPYNLTFLSEDNNKEQINKTLDKVNDKFGDFTLQRASLLSVPQMSRKPNPYLADRRFRL